MTMETWEWVCIPCNKLTHGWRRCLTCGQPARRVRFLPDIGYGTVEADAVQPITETNSVPGRGWLDNQDWLTVATIVNHPTTWLRASTLPVPERRR